MGLSFIHSPFMVVEQSLPAILMNAAHFFLPLLTIILAYQGKECNVEVWVITGKTGAS